MSLGRDALADIRTFPQLIRYLRDDLDWPITTADFDDLTFEYTPEELGIDSRSAAKIQEIKRMRPLSVHQPWGVFFVKFEPKRLPVVALRRILNAVVVKKRAAANRAERAVWETDDLLFISNYGEGDQRQISFAHFSQDPTGAAPPILNVLGWDNLDTPLHIDHVADTLSRKLTWPDDETDTSAWRERWRSAFTLGYREPIRTSRALAVRLARLARMIRDRVRTVLTIETHEGSVSALLRAFREALIHDLTSDDFADMYAQTIAYGLLTARITNPKAEPEAGFAAQLPVTNPFLKELMQTFLHVEASRSVAGRAPPIDFDELGVSDVVEALDSANMEAVIRDFGDRNPEEDPVIHFYELFLTEYDARTKIQRGVFYTPRPVVSYIVRSVHELLQTEFGLADGLADTSTWADMVKRHAGLNIPDGANPTDRFVTVLDPATGTGTFLVEATDVIHRTMVDRWTREGHSSQDVLDRWNDYVSTHLLPRLHGFELLMAPYAIAHLKMGLKLRETGYRFESPERARIYLTNSLEPGQDFSGQFEFTVPALAHEAQAVNTIKRHQRFTVVVGNPPYSGHSSNTSPWISGLVRDYYFVDGAPLGERTSKWLQDDYVKFIRLGQEEIKLAGVGICGLITNHGYLDNPTFRGMRSALLRAFDSVRVVDLHGNLLKRERAPDGTKDENVFDIQPGVAIALLSRGLTDKGEFAYAEAFGLRQSKFRWLSRHNLASTPWKAYTPAVPFLILYPQDSALRVEYSRFWKVTDLFPIHGVGMTTARDHVVIDFDREPLLARAEQFRDSKLSDVDLCRSMGIPMKKGWNVAAARRLLRDEADLGGFVAPVAYRPMDDRLILYHDALVWRTVKYVMHNMLAGRNVALAVGRAGQVIDRGEWNLAYVTRNMTDFNLFRRGGNNLCPLFGFDEHGGILSRGQRSLNLSTDFLRDLAGALEPQGSAHEPSVLIRPEDVFGFLYSVLHSPGYRRRYDEFLRLDFPRIPLPGSLSLFTQLAQLGGELIAFHLLESPSLDHTVTDYIGPTNPAVGRVTWSEDAVSLDAASRRPAQHSKPVPPVFRGVSEAVWNFQIGGYQVCEKWLKDRQSRTLTAEDILHYKKIVDAIGHTIRLMSEIDQVIGQHGGWPAAFGPPGLPFVEWLRPLPKAAEGSGEYQSDA